MFKTTFRHKFLVKRNPTAIEDYKIVSENTSIQSFIQDSIGIQLLKRDNGKTNTIRFNVVYAPTQLIT